MVRPPMRTPLRMSSDGFALFWAWKDHLPEEYATMTCWYTAPVLNVGSLPWFSCAVLISAGQPRSSGPYVRGVLRRTRNRAAPRRRAPS